MAIVTDQTITIHGVSVGISKPIQTLIANGDFTYAELSKFAIVGRHDFVNDKAGVFEPDTYSYIAGTSATISELGKYPVLNSPTAPGWDSVLYQYFGSGNRTYDNYGKMVLVYNMVSSDNTIGVNFNDGNTACIVTEFNPRLIKMIGAIYTGNVVADAGDTGSYTIYDPEASTNFVWYDDDTSAPFRCLCIQNFGDAVYFDFPLYNNIFNTKQNINGNRDSTYVSLDYIFDDYTSTGNKLLSVWCDGGIDDFLVGANYGTSFVGVHDMSDDRGDKILVVRYVPYGAENSVKASSLDTALKQLAGCGFYFEYSGTVYKPITTDGIVTGYTADLSKNGQWDLINDVTGNTVPDTPSGGGGGGDENDPWTNIGAGMFVGSGGAFLSIVTMTSAECESLASKLNSIDVPTGFDPMPAILGMKYFPFSIPGGTASTVKFGIRKGVSADYPTGGSWDTNVGCKVLSDTTTFFDLGTVDIPNRMSQRGAPFLDYDCVYEAYIPFCGVMPLDTNFVTGRRLKAYLYVDVISGNCTGIIYALESNALGAAGIPIAMGSGSCSVEVPVSSNQYGLAKEALLASGVKSVFAIGTGAAQAAAAYSTGNAGNAIGATSSFWEAGTRILRAYTSLNNNLTTCTGISGDQSAFFLPNKAYIKIVRPKFLQDGYYKHSCGIPVSKSGTLSTGYSKAINPDVNVISEATDEEKQMIYGYLTTGVYKK